MVRVFSKQDWTSAARLCLNTKKNFIDRVENKLNTNICISYTLILFLDKFYDVIAVFW